MNRSAIYRLLIIGITLLPVLSFGQQINYDSLLQRVDTVENPVFKPVISFSYGVFNFRGDVSSSLITPLTGTRAGMLSVATFIDRKNHFFVANFNVLAGNLTANEYSHADLTRNLNFKTFLYSFGINVEYRFGHLVPEDFPIRPYIQAGVESLNFSSKGDLTDESGASYYYWSDGSIRDQPESFGSGDQLYRDYDYETDLRLRESSEFGLGGYNQRSLAFPFGAGLHFRINERAFFSLGMSYHLTLTDYLDNVAFEGTSVVGEKGSDSFVFSHLSLHFDLFSDPSTRTVDLLYADADFDALFFDDEDGDFVLDISDRCPGTPYGIEVDSLGCPLDLDLDGVPDYLDRELETARGVWVDEEGVIVSEEAFYALIESRNDAMRRDEVVAYFATIRDEYSAGGSEEIPDKFEMLDEDSDGYISFDELLKTVDLYFDYRLDLDIEEVRELNDFFFSQ